MKLSESWISFVQNATVFVKTSLLVLMSYAYAPSLSRCSNRMHWMFHLALCILEHNPMS